MEHVFRNSRTRCGREGHWSVFDLIAGTGAASRCRRVDRRRITAGAVVFASVRITPAYDRETRHSAGVTPFQPVQWFETRALVKKCR